ncbi:alpha/beta hydrolase [Flammeovirga yaeyamensis]|uniref:Alpha/beta hydrolase n=1 Tax=Flammeovirga yaeyamensis TaxID=367791 RepID=A0AAX1N5H9_9BACT|nr:alpha/beta hydrolase-fold protein [Flammeovirga yaeyamensis]MBB3697332.1 putative alpha/beta superfamily hydrolase [Flammeovirga yaeyamensis]NMF36026.1 histidine kinase [Flammeovirga yaeyamensis]QWG02761.1 alpha/beta hydrolase [Flammeovirga yaeyamensis]
MKYLLYLFLFLLSLTSCDSTSNSPEVTWKITLNQPVEKDIFITGNQQKLGNWDPSAIQLSKIDNQHYTFSSFFEVNDLVEYKFTQGDWKFQAADKDGNEWGNLEFMMPDKDTTIEISINNWTDGSKLIPKGQITGNVEYFKDFKIKGLEDRDIIVWLPPSYSSNSRQRFPVLYMHDGQNIIDPKTSSFGVDWQVDETVDQLSKANLLQEMIIVGVYCTKDRNDDYGVTEKGKIYRKAFATDIKKLIDTNYRTLPEKEHTLVAGSSMGGLVSFMIAWEHPDVYAGAISMSPAFKYQEFDYIDLIQKDKKREVIFYIDNGGKGVDVILQPGVDKMISHLKSIGYTSGKDLFLVIDKNAKHSEGDWAKRFPDAIKLFFGKKDI